MFDFVKLMLRQTSKFRRFEETFSLQGHVKIFLLTIKTSSEYVNLASDEGNTAHFESGPYDTLNM